MHIESLEQRRMMSVTSSQDPTTGALTVQGSSGNDNIEVVTGQDTTGNEFGWVIDVDTNTVTIYNGVTGVSISGGNGSDIISYNGNLAASITGSNQGDQFNIWDFSSAGCTVTGGTGDDIFSVNQASTTGVTVLHGGDGKDSFDVNTVFSQQGIGNVYMDGGNASDQFVVAAENVTVNGGNGTDSLVAVDSNVVYTNVENVFTA